jgi:predicted enzyme related to lactoylglutathione lyase
MITKLLGQNISTKDPKMIAEFYQSIGAKVFRTFGESYDGSRIANTEEATCVYIWDSNKWGAASAGYVNLVFEVDSLQKTYEELKVKGLNIDPPEKQTWGGYELHLVDPDGNRISFLEK